MDLLDPILLVIAANTEVYRPYFVGTLDSLDPILLVITANTEVYRP